MKQLSLRKRILLLVSSIVMIGMAFIFAFVFQERIHSSERGFADDAHTISLAILPMLQNTLVTGDLATIQQTIDPIVRQGIVKRIVILNASNGKEIIHSSITSNKIDFPVLFGTFVGKHELSQRLPIDIGGVNYGILQIDISDSLLISDLWDITKSFFLVGFVCMAFIIWLLNIALIRGLAPLGLLEDYAIALGNGDLLQLAPAVSVPEIGAVANAFNQMADNITKREQELTRVYKEQKILSNKLRNELELNKQQHILLEQQTRLAALGEMIGNIAHQWRQPLSAISTLASGLKIQQDFGFLTPQEMSNTIDSIIRKTTFLSQTIDDFRDFFREDKQKESFKIANAIRNTFDIVKSSYDEFLIETTFELEDISIDGFVGEFSQVILNLLNNAKDALVANNIEYKYVKIILYKKDSHVIVAISDNAGGVPKDIFNKIFDPYFTTKHQSQGTGLGLYMSAKIIRDHFNGNIFVKNEDMKIDGIVYKGATFYIEL